MTVEGRSFFGDADLSETIAAMVVGAALRAGVAVPRQLKVVGHDDSPLARLFVPSLSSVRVDTAGLGRFLTTRTQRRYRTPPPAAGPETDAVLVVRETT
jgi:DNA-binding LacI/PurR family transcriptional regulator